MKQANICVVVVRLIGSRRVSEVALVVGALCLSGAVYAQADSGGGSGGTFGPTLPASSTPGSTGGEGATGGENTTETPAQSASPTADYARLSPFAPGALSYVPGFFGCADTGGGLRSAFSGEGFYTRLDQPAASASGRGRFISVSVGGSETYTDNVNLAPDDRAISDYITEISPRLQACAQTGRVQGNLVYELNGLIYAHNSQYNHVYNNVAGDTTIELLANHLYLGADTRYGQSAVDPSLSFSGSNALRTGNQTSTWTTNISPYYLQSLGPLGDANLRYRYGRTVYGDSDVPESSINGVYFDLTSPPEYDPVSYDFSAFTQRVRRGGGDARNFFRGADDDDVFVDDQGNIVAGADLFDEGDNDPETEYFDKLVLDLGYRLTPSLKLLASGGLEDDYQPDGTNDRLGNSLWDVGFRWQSAFNTLEARVGHRFFGTSYFVRFSTRGSFWDTSIDYREEPSTQALNSLNSNGTAQATSFATPTTSLFGRGVFVQKEVSASVGLHSALTRTTITAFRQNREYIQTDIPDEHFTGARVQINYQFQPRTSVEPFAGWERRDSRMGSTYDTSEAGLSLIRAISPTVQAGLSYGHSWRNSDDERSDYDENRAILSFVKNF